MKYKRIQVLKVILNDTFLIKEGVLKGTPD